jgi:hypothetical protein
METGLISEASPLLDLKLKVYLQQPHNPAVNAIGGEAWFLE